MEWYLRLGSAVMLLASGIVSIVIVERIHDVRSRDDIAVVTTHLLPSGAAAPLFSLRPSPRSSWPLAPVARHGATTLIDGELKKNPHARCDACTGTRPDLQRDRGCW
jgi:hypothetical protein